MTFCPECGEKLEKLSKFCKSCGKKLTDVAENVKGDAKEVEEVVEKSGGGGGIIVFIIILIALGIGAYFYFGSGGTIPDVVEPQLSVTGVSVVPHFSLTQGCSADVEGYVSNQGNANAEGVSVSCRLTGSGGNNQGSKTLGSISKGSNSYFSMKINNDCPQAEGVECTASCSNC